MLVVVAKAAVSPASGWRGTFRALRHRNFRYFAIGQMLSLVGTWIQNVAQNWLVYRLTHSELLLGTTQFATHIPLLLLAPLGGVTADHCSKRKIILITQTLFMVQAFTLAWLTFSGRVTVPLVIGLCAVHGIINAFDVPARQSLLVQLSGREDLLNAVSLNSFTFQMARLVGPAVAGLAVAAFGEGPCFAANGVSFFAVLAGLAMMRLPPKPEATGPRQSISEGFRFAFGTPRVRRLLLLSAGVNFSLAPMITLVPFFADDLFGRGAQGVGYVTSAMAAGALFGSLGMAGRSAMTGLDGVIRANSALLGLSLIGYALAPSFWVLLVMVPVVGYALMRQNTATNTSVQTAIPDEYRGRIMALYSMTVIGMMPVGGLAAGWLASHYGARATVVCGGLFCLAASAWFRGRQ
jgi:MFS family permease